MDIKEKRESIIGIIGASIAGITCAYQLSRAGYNVKLFTSESDVFNPNMRIMDIKYPFIDVNIDQVATFLFHLEQQGVISKKLVQRCSYAVDGVLKDKSDKITYFPMHGMNSFFQHLLHWVDYEHNKTVNSLVYIGGQPTRKRSWAINFDDSTVFECDSVIFATSKESVWNILSMVQNKYAIRHIMATLSQLKKRYYSAYVLFYDDFKEAIQWNIMSYIQGKTHCIFYNNGTNKDANTLKLILHSYGDTKKNIIEENSYINKYVPYIKKDKIIDRIDWISEYPIKDWSLPYIKHTFSERSSLGIVCDYWNEKNTFESALFSGYSYAQNMS